MLLEKKGLELGLEIVCQKDIFLHTFPSTYAITSCCQELVCETLASNKVYTVLPEHAAGETVLELCHLTFDFKLCEPLQHLCGCLS